MNPLTTFTTLNPCPICSLDHGPCEPFTLADADKFQPLVHILWHHAPWNRECLCGLGPDLSRQGATPYHNFARHLLEIYHTTSITPVDHIRESLIIAAADSPFETRSEIAGRFEQSTNRIAPQRNNAARVVLSHQFPSRP